MQQFSYTIQDALGFHARPAGLLVQLARELDSTVTVSLDGKSTDACRLIALMGLNIKQGQTVLVRVEGPHEQEDCRRVERFFQENV
jgi:phosphocarrier protein